MMGYMSSRGCDKRFGKGKEIGSDLLYRVSKACKSQGSRALSTSADRDNSQGRMSYVIAPREGMIDGQRVMVAEYGSRD